MSRGGRAVVDHTKTGNSLFSIQPKVSCELLSLTYGVFVAKLLKDANDHNA